MSFELNIVDMYSDILNIYGDIGNLKCIKKDVNGEESRLIKKVTL